jgi:nitrate reductase NapD
MHPLESISISSVVVNAHPDRIRQVMDGLATLPGVEVHVATEEGKLIVTIESDSDKSVAKTFEAINQQPGVLSASMVYHQYETNPDEEV